MKKPKRVAVTGAAGHIGYSILPRIAAGEVFDRRVAVDDAYALAFGRYDASKAQPRSTGGLLNRRSRLPINTAASQARHPSACRRTA